MPKEVFGSVDPFCTSIGWRPAGPLVEGAVQIGTVGIDGKSLNWSMYGTEERLAFIGEKVVELVEGRKPGGSMVDLGGLVMNVLDCVPGSEFDELPGYRGAHADHNRDQVNAIIKTLRRARDAAFGADA